MTKMTRISAAVSQKIEALAQDHNVSKSRIIEEAVKAYEKELFFKKIDADYARLQQDPKAWKEYQDELAEWDVTLKDGLDDE